MERKTKAHIALGGRLAGEFVIIVLGVLTALAVDNWRESREAQILQTNYLSRLADDLSRDLDDIGVATWAAMAQARATTTLLEALNDPQAFDIPMMTESLKSVDFTRPAHEVIDTHFGGLVWIVKRDRSFETTRATFDEMLSTGRLLVIEDPDLRKSIIDYYSNAEGLEGLGDWMAQSLDAMETVLQRGGYNAFDYNYIDDPLPLLLELDGLAVTLRDVRRKALRKVGVFEQIENNARELKERIESQ